MSDQDVFGDNNNPTPAGDPSTSQNDPFADQLSVIKNENGEPKYKDVGTALEALNSSQQFIGTLKSEKATIEQELANAKAELAKMGSIEDFVNKISPNAEPNGDPVTPETSGGLSEEKVAQLLDQRLQAQSAKAAEDANLTSVIESLSSVHGDKTAEHIKTKAAELKITPAALKEMAKTNPTVALTLLGGGNQTSSAPAQSTTIPPMTKPDDNSPPVFERGVARGGYTNKELVEMFRQSKEHTNKRLGLEN